MKRSITSILLAIWARARRGTQRFAADPARSYRAGLLQAEPRPGSLLYEGKSNMQRGTRRTLAALVAIVTGVWAPFLAVKVDAATLTPDPPSATPPIIVVPGVELSGTMPGGTPVDPVASVSWEEVCSMTMDCQLEKDFFVTEITWCILGLGVGIFAGIKMVRAIRAGVKAAAGAKEGWGLLAAAAGVGSSIICLEAWHGYEDWQRCKRDMEATADASADAGWQEEILDILDHIEEEFRSMGAGEGIIIPTGIGT